MTPTGCTYQAKHSQLFSAALSAAFANPSSFPYTCTLSVPVYAVNPHFDNPSLSSNNRHFLTLLRLLRIWSPDNICYIAWSETKPHQETKHCINIDDET